MSALLELLKQQFSPEHAAELDATIQFSWPQGHCSVGVHDGKAIFYEGSQSAPEAELILYFKDEKQALDIFSGRDNPVAAFMRGEFRSNGYLVWVFQTLAAFSRPATAS